jgi:hypothetical protein
MNAGLRRKQGQDGGQSELGRIAPVFIEVFVDEVCAKSRYARTLSSIFCAQPVFCSETLTYRMKAALRATHRGSSSQRQTIRDDSELEGFTSEMASMADRSLFPRGNAH